MHSSIGLTSPPGQQPAIPSLNVLTLSERRSSAARFQTYLTMMEALADFVAVVAAVMSGYGLYHVFGLGKHLNYPRSVVLAVSATLGLVVVLMLDRAGGYSRGTSLLRVRETERVLRVSMQAFGFAFCVSFFASFLFSRWLLVIALALVPLFLFIEKHLIYLLVQHLHSKGIGIERVLIYGSGSTGRRVYSVLRRSPKLGLEPIAMVDDNPQKTGSAIFELAYERRRSATVIRGPITGELVRRWAADLVIIAIPSLHAEQFNRTVDQTLAANARVSFVPSHFIQTAAGPGFQDIDGVLLASLNLNPHRFGYEWAKRICDFGGAALLLVLSLPVLLLLSIIVRLDSKGPALFRQERIGLNGRRFRMFKFRTMHKNAPRYAFSPKAPDDERITRVGRFLRRLSLDELPQLINVLLGDMSLVGPRPEMPFIVENYTERHRQRLQVKPGITGLWQLSGDRNYYIHENIEYDLYYIQYRNFFMDLAILLHTPIFAMRGI